MSVFRASVVDTGLYSLVVAHLGFKEKLDLWDAFPGIELAELVTPWPVEKRYRTDALRQVLRQQGKKYDGSGATIEQQSYKVGILENEEVISIDVLGLKGTFGVDVFRIVLLQGSAILARYNHTDTF